MKSFKVTINGIEQKPFLYPSSWTVEQGLSMALFVLSPWSW